MTSSPLVSPVLHFLRTQRKACYWKNVDLQTPFRVKSPESRWANSCSGCRALRSDRNSRATDCRPVPVRTHCDRTSALFGWRLRSADKQMWIAIRFVYNSGMSGTRNLCPHSSPQTFRCRQRSLKRAVVEGVGFWCEAIAVPMKITLSFRWHPILTISDKEF